MASSTRAKPLSEEEFKKISDEVYRLLCNTRHEIMTIYPFWGNIAMNMELVPVRDKRVRTMCTDGSAIYADCDFALKLSQDQLNFVIAHEIGHCIMLHLTRRMSREPTLFNIATDKEINYLLKQDGFIAPPNLCWPEGDEIGKCAEEIYEMMLKKLKKQLKQMGQSGSDSSSGSCGSSSSAPSSSGSKSSKGSKGSNNGHGGNADGKLEGQFDSHQYKGDEDDESTKDGGSVVTDRWGEVGYDKNFDPKVSKDYNDRMRETVIAEAQRTIRNRGKLPAGIKSFIDKLLTPEIKWQDVLARFVTNCYNGERKWIPPNRRYVHKRMYMQSRRSEMIRVAIGIDTSGSCQGDLKKFLSEISGLVSTFGSYELHIIQCDAKVDKYDIYDDNNPLDLEHYKFEFRGGGGTDARPIFDFILDNSIEADCAVVFTDGYTVADKDNPIGVPVLWMITKDGCTDFCDWGEKFIFKTDYDRSYDYDT